VFAVIRSAWSRKPQTENNLFTSACEATKTDPNAIAKPLAYTFRALEKQLGNGHAREN